MPEIVEKCPLCFGKKFSIFKKGMFYSYFLTYVICKKCGFVFQSPRMSETEYNSFCAEDYYCSQEKKKGLMENNAVVQKQRAEALSVFGKGLIPLGSRHLDIGCATGILLQCFQYDYETSTMGIEPDKNRRFQARKKNLVVYESLSELLWFHKTSFDLITIIHTLEHVRNPLAYLIYLRDYLLAENGYLLIEVPNLYAHDSFELSHLFAFSSRTLKELIRAAGFKIIKFEKHGNPHSKILPVYLTILCQPKSGYSKLYYIKKESLVKLKRWLGLIWMHILVTLFARGKWFVKDKG